MPLFSRSAGDGTSIAPVRPLLLKSTALALTLGALAVATPAFAQNECGAPVAGVVTCTAPGNPYPGGITYAPPAGDIRLTTNADVTATGTVRVTGTGTTTVVNNGTIATTGNDRPGLFAVGVSAVVTSTGTVSTSGTRGTTSNGDGISATATAGNATVTVRDILVTGPASAAAIPVRPRALVVTATGAATATINGNVSSLNGDAVVVTGATSTINVASNASVGGGVNGVVMAGTTSVSLTNAGTIRGGSSGAAVLVSSGTGPSPQSGTTIIANSGTIGIGPRLAIWATRGATTVNNSGTINGYVLLSYLNDNLNNSGTFIAWANSDFGDGDDRFVNTGTLNLFPAGTLQSAIEFTGLEAFNNSGTISLANGNTANTFILPGTYSGSGSSTLNLDVVTGASPSSDRLVVQGAATGSTEIVLNGLTSSNATVVNSGIVLATGGAGTSTTAFTIAGHSQDIGFINYAISTSSSAGVTSFVLVGTPGDSVLRALRINEASQNLWHKSADAVATHTADLRDSSWQSGSEKPRSGTSIWGVAYGGVQERSGSQTGGAFGIGRSVDTSYKQDSFGAQLGIDFDAISGKSSLILGATGGYVGSDLSFPGATDQSEFSVINLGVYANFVSGPAFASVLAKYDRYSIDSTNPLAGFDSSYDGKSYGVQGELGVRFGSDRLFAEPILTAAYVQTDIDSPNVPNGAVLDFDRLDGVRGKAGLRLGAEVVSGAGAQIVLYVSGNAVHEFEGDNALSFTSNNTTFRYGASPIGTYGEGTIGFNLLSAGGVTGYIEGFGSYGSDYEGGGARAGLRLTL